MLAQWRYPGHLNTQGLPLVIVNQIMMPRLHCIVISVIQPFQRSLFPTMTNPEAIVSFFIYFEWSRQNWLICIRSVCITCFPLSFPSLRALSGRHGTSSGRMSTWSKYSPQGRLNSSTVSAFCRWQSAMPSTPCSITPRINWMLWKR